MARPRSKAETFRFVLECAAHVAVILAVPFFFVQQGQQATARLAQQASEEKSQRAESAMRFIQMANDAERAAVRANLGEPWEKVNATELMENNPTDAGLASAKLLIVETVKDRDIEKLTEFYKAVLLCRNAGYCDAKLIDDFFKEEIAGFYCSYDGRLAQIAERLNRPDYVDVIKVYTGPC